MKKITWNEYVDFCNAQEAKRHAANKAFREAHPTFCKIMDVVSTIMIIVGVALMLYSAVQEISAKVCKFKDIIRHMKDKIDEEIMVNKAAESCPDEIEPQE